ncbi:cytochrome c oxidase accessory protein CcoG [Emticicia sp. CRIBPO]|uniref:cytochrome c oxidase accessory protein CcoG n=1 Tax=Emticicia sp. CRIBPO TaxID=2683258 RepID=UPI00141240CC|nr:cytochrome c oxidase accessory protein CcoG [Emticicia sp. CRIBPO]NBA85915.1 cytochrome c oxidase accessory protein CcoG [Emticicia sp. CRIBPO]
MAISSDISEFYDEEYRDTIATVDKNGKRIWLHPKKPKGSFHNKRIIATIVFLTIFFAVPFIKIKGEPLLMMNIFERKFVIFGQVFFPQDFILFGIGMIIFFVFIILFTVVYGRFWCGWACPQTIFLEMVFRKIEYWIEGDARQQQKLDSGPWTSEKVRKKVTKHAIFIFFSIIIAHLTMSYMIGIEETLRIATSSPASNPTGFIGVVAFTAIFYFVFTRLREQVCIAICPYGRLQGVLMGKSTMAIMYDFVRGEPRGKLKKQEEKKTTHGDCIDCALCVQVCPTGIDIRNGTQLECVNCTACIDACDEVMFKINKPAGLIRYASEESIEKGTPFRMSRRAYYYSAVLLMLIGLEAYLLIGRTMVDTTILRVPGQMYQEQPNGKISNLYNAQIINKTSEEIDVTLKVAENKGRIRLVGDKVHLPKQGRTEIIFFLDMDKKDIKQIKTPLKIEVYQGNKLIETIKTNFLGPEQ